MHTRKSIFPIHLFFVIPCTFLLYSVSLSEPVQQDARAEIAVLPLRNLRNITTPEIRELTEWIVFKIFSLGEKNILSQKDIERLVSSDRSINLETCFSDECMFAVGSLLNVEKIIWGTVEPTDIKTILLLSLGDVSEKKIINTVAKQIKGPLSNAHQHLSEMLTQLLQVDPELARDTTPPPPKHSSVELTSEPPGALIKINGEVMGITPFKIDSLDSGTYEIALDLNRYKPFSKKIFIPEGVTKKYLIKLVERYGHLTVLTAPSQASITMNNKPVGKTPFSCDTIESGYYKLNLTYPKYVPCTTSVTIYRGKTDTVKVKLISQAYVDSIKQAKKKKRRIFRRIVFGTLTAGFTAIGVYYNNEAQNSLADEDKAYSSYNQPDLSDTEYKRRWDIYEDAAKKTDKFMNKRNAFYIIGGVFGIGLGISIFF